MATLNCFACFGDDQHPVRDGISSGIQGKVQDLFSVLWDLSLGGVTNLLFLYRNAQRLLDEMTQLEQLRDDVNLRMNVEVAQPQVVIMHQVGGWLDRVEVLRSEVIEFQAALERQSLFVTGFCLGYRAVDTLRRARELAGQGRTFSNVTSPAAPGSGTLTREMNELRDVLEDLLRVVRGQEMADPQMRRTSLVESWVEAVHALQRSSDGSSEAPAAAEITDKLRLVRDLKARGSGLLERKDKAVSRLPPGAVEELPSIPDSSIVGMEETLSEIRCHLRDVRVGIIGIFGMGGVGKTTLLTKINNELLETEHRDMFDVVAWATVSKDMNILAIQFDIGERVGLQFSKGEEGSSSRLADDQAKLLFKSLSQKRFLIFLDDVWQQLDLKKIGIPHPGGRKNCKIAFTTRSVEVCSDMDADRRVAVNPLDEPRSWELFRRKVGSNEALNDPSIRPLAEQVVKRCGGLPLALITVGRAMASKETRNEWDHAIRSLDESATELRGMDSVLSTLKFSYDRLENETLKACLLYCVLFPEDDSILREDLVEYWVGEGLLDDDEKDRDINHARNRGHVIIGRLQDACLLESIYWLERRKAVRMHDAIRDMGLWLTSGEYDKSNKFLAMAAKGLTRIPPIQQWEDARRISLSQNNIEGFPVTGPNCPNLSTLLLQSTYSLSKSPVIAGAFFKFMPLLRVLVLMGAEMDSVPAEICSLVELRCLNLSHTRITSLPMELCNLIKLRQLMLENTSCLKRVPREAITRLTNLQVLSLYDSHYPWDHDTEEIAQGGYQQLGVRDLKNLCWLSDLRITLHTRHSLRTLTSSDVLLRATTYLSLKCPGLVEELDGGLSSLVQVRDLLLDLWNSGSCTLCFLPGHLPALEYLYLFGYGYLVLQVQVVPGHDLPLRNLRSLNMGCCDLVDRVTWAGQLPCLESIILSNCHSMSELLEDGEAGRGDNNPAGDYYYDTASFPRLRILELSDLPQFRRFCKRFLLLPRLEELHVSFCPELKRLPLGPRSARIIREIEGEPEWWDALEWDEHEDGRSVQSRLNPYFKPL